MAEENTSNDWSILRLAIITFTYLSVPALEEGKGRADEQNNKNGI